MRAAVVLFVLSVVPSQFAAAQGAPDARYRRALSTLYTTSQVVELVKAWCDERAPETRSVTDTVLVAWKLANQFDAIDARADVVLANELPSLRAGVQSRRASVFRSLDKDSKSPAADCLQMRSYLDRSANPRRLHPNELRLVMQTAPVVVGSAGSAPSTPSTPSTPSPPSPPSTPSTPNTPNTSATPQSRTVPLAGRAQGSMYTVAQLSAIESRDVRTAEQRLKQMGTLTVQGTLEAYSNEADATVWLNTVRDGWRSTNSVKCYDLDVTFRTLYDAGRRDVTIRGTVRNTEYWIVLENCQLVANTAGLSPSTVSDSSGLKRAPVSVASLRTAPNAGLTMAQIEGMYQSTELRYNAMSMLYEPDESTYLLLKDGWLYDNLRLSPHDLDVETSRRLEPQNWHRWRRAGTGIEVQEYDEHGRTDGEWSRLKALARPAIAGRRLNGTFSDVTSATAGISGGGGAFSMSTTSFTFRPDGTFSWTNFSQLYGNSNVGTGPGGGTIVVGGAVVGPGGTSVSSVGGGDDGGTYTTDGYTLELRTRSGRVLRYSLFAWDSEKYRDYLVINGTTYSPPKR